jgi:hypothetical protein
MSIRVRFDNDGWYHPMFGRLGRGDGNAGKIYVLPDMFGEKETIKVPVMDRTSKPPRQIGEKEITRYKYLPSSVEILDDEAMQALADEAEELGEDPPKTVRPAQSEMTSEKQIPGRGKEPKPMDATERTTGTAKKRATRRPAVR